MLFAPNRLTIPKPEQSAKRKKKNINLTIIPQQSTSILNKTSNRTTEQPSDNPKAVCVICFLSSPNIIKNNSDPFKKAKIIRKELIFFLNENDIFNNILMIIQYVYDYIIYNSIQKKLALKNSKDLQFFLDIKNYMYFSC